MINLGVLTAHHYPRLGGMEFAMHNFSNSLHQLAKVNVSLACNSLNGVPKDFHYDYNCYRSKRFSYLTPFLFKYNQEKMIREQSINILHGPMLHDGGYFCYQQKLKHNIPFVGQSHGADVQLVKEIGYGALLNETLKQRIVKVMRHANHLVAVSRINKENMIDIGAEEHKISVIPNGIEIEKINHIPFQSQRHSWGVEEEDFLIISVGRNKPVKRMGLLFQALQLLKEYKSIKCICVGPKQDLEKQIASYKLTSKVVLTGQIPKQLELGIDPPYHELINAYKSCNVYVSTSYVESFGMAAADALACGIPIIVGAKHGVQDILKPDQTGWAMEQESPEELAALILESYNKREQLKASSIQIKESVSHLNWTYIAKEYEQLFKRLI